MRHKDSPEGDLRVPKVTSKRACNRIAGCRVFQMPPIRKNIVLLVF
jgi:hypothetical protein|tara:strand:- start:793 stop:930 length:138 start_codon:yes stop_codon:yes gene_type:complete